MNKSFEEIFSEIESLLKNYTNEFRTSVQPFRHEIRKQIDPSFKFEPEDRYVRESLIEHVGALPILAVYFHSHVTEPVNLGRVLEMLAIHDIGETTMGDEIIFTKTDESENLEAREALKLLDKQHHDIYQEFLAQKTNEAKFAKSVDKISPGIYDGLTDVNITKIRLKHFANMDADVIVDTMIRFKSPYMQWSAFFREFHDGLMVKLRRMFDEAETKA